MLRSLAATSAVFTAFALGFPAPADAASGFRVTPLVSDGFVAAPTIDPGLVNPWGISYSPTGPFWLSDNGTGLSTLYDSSGAKIPLTVNVAPPAGGSGSAPTGQVFNGSSTDFMVSNGSSSAAAAFIFDTEDGTISGWAPSLGPTQSYLAVDHSNAGAVYKGLAIGTLGGNQYIYASNFRAGDVEMYDSHFNLIGSFTDPTVAAGYAPFNVQDIGDTLYVSFALQDAAKHDDVAGAGNGYVDAFSLNGTFERRIVSKGAQVNSPWGLDIAPSDFGAFANDLLVGNFGDGTISVFDPTSGGFLGMLSGPGGVPLHLGDLWGLINGNGGAGGDAGAVYFTAGIVDEAHGVFGEISPAPEPAAWALMLLGFGAVGGALRRRGLATG